MKQNKKQIYNTQKTKMKVEINYSRRRKIILKGKVHMLQDVSLCQPDTT